MPDRSDEFRKLATDCMAIASTMSDPGHRAMMLTMAQKWFDLANGPATNLDTAVREFNMAQMRDALKPATQQQQQIPPKTKQ